MEFLTKRFRRSPDSAPETQRAELVREQAARVAAEAAHRRMAFLAEASTVLSSSLDHDATLKSVARLVVPYLADWCAIDVRDADGRLERLAIAHMDPAREAFARQWYTANPIPENARHGVPNVLRSAKPELWRTLPDCALERSARSAEELAAFRGLGLRSVMIVPLVMRDRVLGAITFVTSESEREYGEGDLVLAEDLAHRVAMAVENARLYRETDAAGERLRHLQSVTETALSHLAVDDLLPEILTRIRRALGTETAAIVLRDEGGGLTTRAAVGFAAEPPRDVRIPIGRGFAGRVAAEDRSLAVADVTEVEILCFRDTRIRSLLGVPLRVAGAVIGVLHVGTCEPRRFSEDDVQFLELVADRVAVAIDRAQLYQAEQRARRSAEAASRMKDEFLATVSHELRTPLTAILGWARLLRSGRYALPPAAAPALETIERNARAQAQLIEDLLDVSRIITGRLRLDLRPIDLGAVAEAAVDAMRPTAAAKGLVLSSAVDPSASAVLGDPDRLQQVIWNLLANAVKFTPAGGCVDVEVRSHGPHAQVVVTDTGKGIGAEFLPFIFDRFRQEDASATRAHGGLGLGLAIVRHLVEMHGGTVRAESAGEGQGSTFTVTLPRQVGDVDRLSRDLPGRRRARSAGWRAAGAALTGCRVLVVDDETDSRDTIAAMLVEHGAEVSTARSADEALAAIGRAMPDVLVADIGMPEIDGYDLIRRVRQAGGAAATLRAIAVTAYARAEDRIRAIEAGYDAHMAKPVDPAALASTVADLRRD